MPLFRTRPCRRLPVPALLLSGMLSLPGAMVLGAVLMLPALWMDPMPAGLGAVAGMLILGPFLAWMALPAGLAVLAILLRTGWAGWGGVTLAGLVLGPPHALAILPGDGGWALEVGALAGPVFALLTRVWLAVLAPEAVAPQTTGRVRDMSGPKPDTRPYPVPYPRQPPAGGGVNRILRGRGRGSGP